MATPVLKKLSTGIIGATFLAWGTISAPAQATTLTGFRTFGNQMDGMQITVDYLDGGSQTAIWGDTGNREEGGASGNGWSLLQAGDTFGNLWRFTNGRSSRSINRLKINATTGNAVFDVVESLSSIYQTPGSAEGRPFQFNQGRSPSSANYSAPIDISRGDLFGILTLTWNNGFRPGDQMSFWADTDSGSSNDPIKPVEVIPPPPVVTPPPPVVTPPPPVVTPPPPPPNNPPSLTFALNGSNSDISIYESQSLFTTLTAVDPQFYDDITFFVDGQDRGTVTTDTTGDRTINIDRGTFGDDAKVTYTAIARDSQGAYSNSVSRTLTVLNVAPTLTAFNLLSDTIDEGQSAFANLFSTDPGADPNAFSINDGIINRNIGTDYNTSGIRSASTDLGLFKDEGTFTFTGQANDDDGGFSNTIAKTLTVRNVAPTITSLASNQLIRTGQLFDFFATATDPGVLDILTFDWDFDNNGLFDFTNFTGSRGQWSFLNPGIYNVQLRVSDGDGGFAYGSFTVEAVPEPATALGLLAFGVGAAAVLRTKVKSYN